MLNLLQFWLDVQAFKAACISLNVEEHSRNVSSAEQVNNFVIFDALKVAKYHHVKYIIK